VGATSTATLTITVTGTNDAPVASAVVLEAIAEDSGARLISSAELLTGVTDIDSPTLTISALTIATGSGTLVDNGNGTWSYTPAPNDDTAVTFNYTASDGSATASSTASLDITPVLDRPPALDLDANNSNGGGSNYNSTFSIGGPAMPIADVDVSITDPDSTTIASARISLDGNGTVPPNHLLSISGTLPAGISASAYNPATGVLTLTGVASLADYQTALRQVVFSTTSAFFGVDRISVIVNDGAADSNVAHTFMRVSVGLGEIAEGGLRLIAAPELLGGLAGGGAITALTLASGSGTGNDILAGGTGADRFVFADTGAANIDSIADYSFVDGDTIDLSARLDAGFSAGQPVSDFVRGMQSGSNITLQVDIDGGANSFVDVATLTGYGTSRDDAVNVHFGNLNHFLVV
jgi:Ca2+-binding RTX toxin-like protein